MPYHILVENGDAFIDFERGFNLSEEGALNLTETVVQGPMGNPVGLDRSYAGMFASNLRKRSRRLPSQRDRCSLKPIRRPNRRVLMVSDRRLPNPRNRLLSLPLPLPMCWGRVKPLPSIRRRLRNWRMGHPQAHQIIRRRCLACGVWCKICPQRSKQVCWSRSTRPLRKSGVLSKNGLKQKYMLNMLKNQADSRRSRPPSLSRLHQPSNVSPSPSRSPSSSLRPPAFSVRPPLKAKAKAPPTTPASENRPLKAVRRASRPSFSVTIPARSPHPPPPPAERMPPPSPAPAQLPSQPPTPKLPPWQSAVKAL